MPAKLTSREINYIVALYGDISFEARKRLYQNSTLPAHLGAEVLRDGYDFVGLLRDGGHLIRKLAEERPQRRERWRRPQVPGPLKNASSKPV